jgi:hypothetical protein
MRGQIYPVEWYADKKRLDLFQTPSSTALHGRERRTERPVSVSYTNNALIL